MIPRGTNAPKLCPAEPWNVTSIVPSGSPTPPPWRVSSAPSIVPTVRFVFRIVVDSFTSSPRSNAALAAAIKSLSSAFSSPWSWPREQ